MFVDFAAVASRRKNLALLFRLFTFLLLVSVGKAAKKADNADALLAEKQSQYAQTLNSHRIDRAKDSIHLIHFISNRLQRCGNSKGQLSTTTDQTLQWTIRFLATLSGGDSQQLATVLNTNHLQQSAHLPPSAKVVPEFEALLKGSSSSKDVTREQYNKWWSELNCARFIQPMVASFEESFQKTQFGNEVQKKLTFFRLYGDRLLGEFRLHRFSQLALADSLFAVREKVVELFSDLCVETPLAFNDFVAVLWTGFSTLQKKNTGKTWLTVPFMQRLLWSIPGVEETCRRYVKVTEENCKLLDPSYLPSKVKVAHKWVQLAETYPTVLVTGIFEVEAEPLLSGYHQDFIRFPVLIRQLLVDSLLYQKNTGKENWNKEALKETLPLVVIEELEVLKRSLLLLLLGKSNWALNLQWPSDPSPPKSYPLNSDIKKTSKNGRKFFLKGKRLKVAGGLGLVGAPVALGYLLYFFKGGDKKAKMMTINSTNDDHRLVQTIAPPPLDFAGSTVIFVIFLVLFGAIFLFGALFLYSSKFKSCN